MKINVLSDLHLEFGGFFAPTQEADVIILAGDIGLAHKENTFKPFIEECLDSAHKVIMVMGNHEHYGGQIDLSYNLIKDKIDSERFHILEDEFVDYKGIRFIGSTLWSEIDISEGYYISRSLNDYRTILIEDEGVNPVRRLCVQDTTQIFYKSRDYIFKQVSIANHNGIKPFVITHHSPTMMPATHYRGNKLNSAYGSDLDNLIEVAKPIAWVNGHTHNSFDYNVGDTRIICNPRGYYGVEVNKYFNPNLIIEV